VKTIKAVTAMRIRLFNKRSAKIRQACAGMSIMDRWLCFSAHADCTLHVLLLASPAVYGCPGMKEIEQLY